MNLPIYRQSKAPVAIAVHSRMATSVPAALRVTFGSLAEDPAIREDQLNAIAESESGYSAKQAGVRFFGQVTLCMQ